MITIYEIKIELRSWIYFR